MGWADEFREQFPAVANGIHIQAWLWLDARFEVQEAEIVGLLAQLAEVRAELYDEETCRLCGKRGAEIKPDCVYITTARCLAAARFVNTAGTAGP